MVARLFKTLSLGCLLVTVSGCAGLSLPAGNLLPLLLFLEEDSKPGVFPTDSEEFYVMNEPARLFDSGMEPSLQFAQFKPEPNQSVHNQVIVPLSGKCY